MNQNTVIIFKHLALSFFLIFQLSANAQEQENKKKIGREINEEINYDIKTGKITPGVLPFDVPFVIKGEIPHNIVEVRLSIIESAYASNCKPCSETCESCKDDDCNKKQKGNKSEIKTDSTDNDLKNTDENKCPNCNSPDFSYCQNLCSWKLSYINREANSKENTFVIAVPPLKANVNYNFNFSFLKSVETERDTIISRIAPIIAKKVQKYYEDSIIDTIEKVDLQSSLNSNINQYIISTYFYGENISRILVDTNFSDFELMFDEIQLEGNTYSQLLLKKRSTRKKYGSARTNGQIQWKNIIDKNSLSDLYMAISRKDSKTKDDIELLKLLNEIYKPSTVIGKIIGGEISVLNPENDGEELIFKSDSKSIEEYKANITQLKKELISIETYLFRFETNNNERQQIFFSKDELKEFKNLAALEKKNTEQLKTYDDLIKRDFKNQNNIKEVKNGITLLISHSESVRRKLGEFQKSLIQIEELSLKFANQLLENTEVRSISGQTTTADFVTRTSYYVSLDVGFAHIFYENQFSNEIQPYYGFNFHLGPINKQRKYYFFTQCKKLRMDPKNLLKNTSFIAGLTLNSLDNGQGRKNSLKNMSLLTGLGIRISDPVRLSGGVVWNGLESNNPLETKTKLRAYPYVALSFDLDVKKYLGEIGTKVFNLK